MKKINILIVEDEFITLDNLKETIEDLGYVVVGTAMKAEKAIQILELGKTDFVILDINLKGDKDGIWIANQIRQDYQIPFIFLTAFTDAATIKRAVETKPLGYLVKPFTQPSVFAAIEVALNAHKIPQNSVSLDNQFLFVKEDKVYKKIFLNDIRYIEAFKNYLEINLTSGRHIIRSTMKEFFSQLPEAHFLQTHRSFVVNKHLVESVSSESIILKSREIPLTKSFREEVLEQLKVR